MFLPWVLGIGTWEDIIDVGGIGGGADFVAYIISRNNIEYFFKSHEFTKHIKQAKM